MYTYEKSYGVIIIGAGHAGCEAARISAKKGVKTLLLTMNLDTIAKLSCNPSIGGTSKGHIVREIDALGGIMAKVADMSAIHYRLLNRSKGPSVQAPRAQVDKLLYHKTMKNLLEIQDNLEIKQASVEKLEIENGKVIAVLTLEGVRYKAENIILTAGTFMRGIIHMGDISFPGGRTGDSSSPISNSLKKAGIKLGRLKTGTPPRIKRGSIDFSKTERQPSEEGVLFSFDYIEKKNKKVDCYITYTTEITKDIIEKNLKRSALFSGKIKSRGPRYCPSIEDKITRFKNRKRHQIFLEPEGLDTEEFYVNGLSTSMPYDVQEKIIKSVEGLEEAEITRAAYAIEYDYVLSEELTPTLETKKIKNLFLAGQINGTTGYEEAAGQGLIAGINAANKVLGRERFVLKRSDAYIGVMIDDIISKELKEPYRMFTSRAEYRLLLRHDNAIFRLNDMAYKERVIDRERYLDIREKKELISKEKSRLKKVFQKINGKTISLFKMLARPDITYRKLISLFPDIIFDHGEAVNREIELEIKYDGYIKRQEKDIKNLKELHKISIPKDFNFESVKGLRNEALEKLKKFLPENLQLASNIDGVSSADISILMVFLKRRYDKSNLN